MNNTKKQTAFLNMFRRKFYKTAFAVYMFLYGICSDMLMCFAKGTTTEDAAKELEHRVVDPITTIVNIIISGVQAFGVIYLVKSVLELFEAIGSQDNSGIIRAAKGVIAGIFCVAFKWILKLFGYEG